MADLQSPWLHPWTGGTLDRTWVPSQGRSHEHFRWPNAGFGRVVTL